MAIAQANSKKSNILTTKEVILVPRFYNPFLNNNFPGMNFNNQPEQQQEPMMKPDNQTCNCGNINQGMPDCGCQKQCPTTYKCCPPIVTCSKQVINQYHVTKQPYVHNYHTEIVHHHVTENEFIPNYTCSEVHVNEPNNSNYPR